MNLVLNTGFPSPYLFDINQLFLCHHLEMHEPNHVLPFCCLLLIIMTVVSASCFTGFGLNNIGAVKRQHQTYILSSCLITHCIHTKSDVYTLSFNSTACRGENQLTMPECPPIFVEMPCYTSPANSGQCTMLFRLDKYVRSWPLIIAAIVLWFLSAVIVSVYILWRRSVHVTVTRDERFEPFEVHSTDDTFGPYKTTRYFGENQMQAEVVKA